MPDLHVSMDLPEELGKRLKTESDNMGIPPEMGALYILARALRREAQPDMSGVRVIMPSFMQPQPQQPAQPQEELREDHFVAANQRMFAMNIASNLVGIAQSLGKNTEEVWEKFEECYSKVHDKMVKDNGVDKMITPDQPGEDPK